MRSFHRKTCLMLLCVAGVSQCLTRHAYAQAPTAAPQIPTEISDKEAAALEEGLVKNPDDVEARSKLVSYYFTKNLMSRTSDLEDKREKHVFWLIEHHPETELAGSPEGRIDPNPYTGSIDGYQHAKQLWMQNIKDHPNDQAILRNAAQFFLLSDQKYARELLEKAWTIDPNDATTSSALAEIYDFQQRGTNSPEEKSTLAKKVLSIRQSVLEKSSGVERFDELDDAASAAFEAGEPEQAKLYANELLASAPKFRDDWNYGNAIHQGNVILGRIALSRGDIAGAKQYLLAAGQTTGSPQLDSFGPNMTLAKELLEKGESETVLEYLQSCAKFWKMGANNLRSWTAMIKGGGIPDFGANLDY